MEKLMQNKNVKIALIAAIAIVVGIGIFLLVRQQGGGVGISPGTKVGNIQDSNTLSLLNTVASNADSSEPKDAATSIDTNVVDATGLT